ncbi:MAG: threonylcarbamoyl-AMP synthase [Proteobacteria bacterium]|nr:threonylcarbamoyl-AMP synthase [Pseudomonadota bacterium]
MANVLQVNFESPETSREPLETIQSVLDSGGVIAFPTDTFYGLGADPFNPEAISKIFRIKQRPADKPLLVLIHSPDQVDRLTDQITPLAKLLMRSFWPGSLTLLFKAAPGLPSELTAGTGKVGVRLPAHLFTLQLLEGLDCPLTAPSANISGHKEPTALWEFPSTLGEELDLLVDGGPAPGGKPSTILDATMNPPILVREGAVSRKDLQLILPNLPE